MGEIFYEKRNNLYREETWERFSTKTRRYFKRENNTKTLRCIS